MSRNRIDSADYRSISKEYDISPEDIRRIITSFFDILQLEARALPFDNDTRIYSRDKFDEYVKVWNIPFIGRIGPVYSRYLCWRRNESKQLEQELKSSFKEESLKQKADNLAKQILKCQSCSIEKKDKYRRVWVVQPNGKKLARQILPLNEKE